MFIEADWGEKYQRLIERGDLDRLAKEMVKDGYHPDEIDKIIKVIDGPIGGSYTIKGRPEREAMQHMAYGRTAMNKQSVADAIKGGGFSFYQKPGDGPTSGYSVSTHPDREEIIDFGEDAPEHTNPYTGKPGEHGDLVNNKDGQGYHWKKKHARWIELESRKFMADNEDAFSDLHELRTRAANFAALKTSTLPIDQHRAIVAGFVARVNELGRIANRPLRQASRREATVVPDFHDSLMFID